MDIRKMLVIDDDAAIAEVQHYGKLGAVGVITEPCAPLKLAAAIRALVAGVMNST
jgi:DNA-binding NarL/FixJ family response regulator